MQRDYPPEIHAVNGRARAAMKRGLALLQANEDLPGAVQCFDEAIHLRKSVPLEEYCWIRYGLIAGWMNRGDALTRLGGAANLAEAVRNYDEALLQLRELPMNESPLFKQRLAVTWLNRGVTLQTQGLPDALDEALESFGESIAAAQNLFAGGYGEIVETLGCAWMNRGNVLFRKDPPLLVWAQEAVKKSLALLRPLEREKISAAELALKARHILCQIVASRMSFSGQDAGTLLNEASEAVDEGMDLARFWRARGAKQFSGLVDDLFRFGCRVYQIHQPHFLTEFLLENLDPAKSAGTFTTNHDMHLSAVESVWHSLAGIQRDGFKNMNTARFDEILASLRELRVTEERLAELRRQRNESTIEGER